MGVNFLNKVIEHSKEYRAASPTQQQTLKDKAFERWMAFLFLKNSDIKKYGNVVSGLASQYSLKNDQNPDKIVDATNILSSHKHDNHNKRQSEDKRHTTRHKNHEDKKSQSNRGEKALPRAER